jgi:hypothetical protein
MEGIGIKRCPWAKTDLYVQYHDTEWGVPIHDDRLLFEFLVLEGAQAGLNWETILKKRENYRAAFDQFDPATVAKYGQKKRKGLLSDSGVPHRSGRTMLRCRWQRTAYGISLVVWQWSTSPGLEAGEDMTRTRAEKLPLIPGKLAGVIARPEDQVVGLVMTVRSSSWSFRYATSAS